ncbi:hypothetical protein B7494_g5778 [Chlorociboria aeruginascens]|nr:hypothetical protein B7494_g5778 [Chlorociboria aeruginascens]
MAEKEASIYIIDQGASTGDCHNGRVESDLDYSLKYVWDKITAMMAAGRKTDQLGVIGLRTDETNNPLQSDDGYDNISVLMPLGTVEMSALRQLQKKVRPSNTESGDALSAIVLAVDMIEKATTLKSGKLGKFARTVCLVTNGLGPVDPDQIDQIAQKINDVGIKLVVIGVDFDDAEFGFKEEDKDLVKGSNESVLKDLTDKCSNGVFGTAAEAILDLSVPRLKKTRPYSPYEGKLTLGDPEKYPETSMAIEVKRFFKTKAAKPVSASSFVTKSEATNKNPGELSGHTIQEDSEMVDAPDLSAVKSMRTYKINDSTSEKGKRDIPFEELAKGYSYGSTAVPISESEQNITKLETHREFTIIGFVHMDKYEKYLTMGESCITVAQKGNDKAIMALSSFVHALHELESHAVARIVTKDGKDPQIVLLAPFIEPDLEALIDVPLPFAEDFRTYRFPPLDRVITTSGGILTKHRNLPTEDLTEAMSDYVDCMDLSMFGQDDEGQPAEYMTIDDTYSPLLHRIDQAIRKRAAKPDDPIEPPADILLKWSNPPSELISKSTLQLEKLITVADVKQVPPKAKGTRGRKDVIKPLSGLDVKKLLGQEKRQRISKENAIPEFKQMLATAESENVFIDAANQMASITRSMITNSYADKEYPRAVENLRVMREELIHLEVPEIYNNFIRDLKQRVVKGELGGNRSDLWWLVTKTNKLGLIDKEVSERSDVSREEALEFPSIKTDLPSRVKAE